MTQPSVNIHNWRQCEGFVEFLTLEFNLDNLDAERKSLIAHLLPIAVAENRLLGAITNAILEAAIAAWNRPALFHIFTLDNHRWKYFGATDSLKLSRLNPDENIRVVHGRAKRIIPFGAFCKTPLEEIDLVPIFSPKLVENC